MSVWLHNGCGGRVFWDHSGGFCDGCEAEGLTPDEATPEVPDSPATLNEVS